MDLLKIGTGEPTAPYIRLSAEERVLLGYEWCARERFSPWQFRCHLGPLTLLIRGAVTVDELVEAALMDEELDILRCPRCLCTCEITPEGMRCECGWQTGDDVEEETAHG
jgi:hypothetical protein